MGIKICTSRVKLPKDVSFGQEETICTHNATHRDLRRSLIVEEIIRFVKTHSVTNYVNRMTNTTKVVKVVKTT